MEEATVKNIVNFLKGQKTVQLDSEEPRKKGQLEKAYQRTLQIGDHTEPEDSEYIYFQQSVLADGIGTLRTVEVEFGPKESVSDDDWILNDLGILDNLLEVKGIKVFQQGLFEGKFAKWILDPEYRMVSKKDWRESTKWLESNNIGPIVETNWSLPVKTMEDFIRFFRSEPNWVPVITVPTGNVFIEGEPNFTDLKYRNDLKNNLIDESFSIDFTFSNQDVKPKTESEWAEFYRLLDTWKKMKLNESYKLIGSFEEWRLNEEIENPTVESRIGFGANPEGDPDSYGESLGITDKSPVNFKSEISNLYLPKDGPIGSIRDSAWANLNVPTRGIPGTNGGNLGCAAAVSIIFYRATGLPIRKSRNKNIELGTAGLWTEFTKSNTKDWKMIVDWRNDSQPGDIILTSRGKKAGHVGVVVENNKIISNSSGGFQGDEKGQIELNYTIKGWEGVSKRNPQQTASFRYIGPYLKDWKSNEKYFKTSGVTDDDAIKMDILLPEVVVVADPTGMIERLPINKNKLLELPYIKPSAIKLDSNNLPDLAGSVTKKTK